MDEHWRPRGGGLPTLEELQARLEAVLERVPIEHAIRCHVEQGRPGPIPLESVTGYETAQAAAVLDELRRLEVLILAKPERCGATWRPGTPHFFDLDDVDELTASPPSCARKTGHKGNHTDGSNTWVGYL